MAYVFERVYRVLCSQVSSVQIVYQFEWDIWKSLGKIAQNAQNLDYVLWMLKQTEFGG